MADADIRDGVGLSNAARSSTTSSSSSSPSSSTAHLPALIMPPNLEEISLMAEQREKHDAVVSEKEMIEKRLRAGFQALDFNGDGLLDLSDLTKAVKQLGHATSCSPRILKEIIWESDGNGDGKITFEDVFAMYHRVRLDKKGVEPFRILDFVDFASADTMLSGSISSVQVISMMTQRSGHNISRNQVKVMSSSNDWSFGSRVTLTEFIRQMKTRQSLTRNY